jgi:hypothetical protein
MPTAIVKQRRFMYDEIERLQDRKKTLRVRLLEAKHAGDRRRAPRFGPTTLLLRRLRFGSEWL